MSCSCRCHLGGAYPSCDTGTPQPGGSLSCSPCDGEQVSARGPGSNSGDSEPLLTARDHWNAVDQLTQPSRTRLQRDNGHGEWVQLPSLLDQLYEAMESGAGDLAHGVPASKPPMDAAALSLLLEIATTIRDAFRESNKRAVENGQGERIVRRTMDNKTDLRKLASMVNATGNPQWIDGAARLARSWVARIKATISNDPDRTWRLHGAACTVCGSTRVPVYDPDGTETHQPALIVRSEDGVIVSIRCDFCGSSLAGPDLVDIVRRAPRAAVGESA